MGQDYKRGNYSDFSWNIFFVNCQHYILLKSYSIFKVLVISPFKINGNHVVGILKYKGSSGVIPFLINPSSLFGTAITELDKVINEQMFIWLMILEAGESKTKGPHQVRVFLLCLNMAAASQRRRREQEMKLTASDPSIIGITPFMGVQSS